MLFIIAKEAAEIASAPLSIGAVVMIVSAMASCVATVLMWITFYFKAKEFKAGQLARQKQDATEQKQLIADICKQITESDSYLNRRDKQLIQLAASVVDEEFRLRASSFVDAAADERTRTDVDRRLTALEKSVGELRTHFDAASKVLTQRLEELMSGMLKELKQGK